MTNREKIAQLNDQFRQTLGDEPGQGMVMISMKAKEQLSIQDHITILDMIREFDDFNPKDDPNGDRSAGLITLDNQKVHWIIAYFDKDLKVGSLYPENDEKTERVLIITLDGEHNEYLSTKSPLQ